MIHGAVNFLKISFNSIAVSDDMIIIHGTLN